MARKGLQIQFKWSERLYFTLDWYLRSEQIQLGCDEQGEYLKYIESVSKNNNGGVKVKGSPKDIKVYTEQDKKKVLLLFTKSTWINEYQIKSMIFI